MFLFKNNPSSDSTIRPKASALLTYALVFSFAFTTACIRKHREPIVDGSAQEQSRNFRVVKVYKVSSSVENHPEWNIPVSKTYKLRACLLAISNNNQVASGQEFKVISTEGARSSFVVDETDDVGCIDWEEKLDFNFSSDSIYIAKSKVIEAKSKVYQGQETIRFAINPLAEYRGDGEEEVVDLNRQPLPSDRMVQENPADPMRVGSFSRNEESTKLYIKDPLRIQLVHKGDLNNGKKMEVIVRAQPFLLPLNRAGENAPKYLTQGSFRVFANLVSNYIGKDSKEMLILTPNMVSKKVKMHPSGILNFQMTLPLTRKVSMGQVQLALKIVPLNTPFEMQAYQGLFNIGKFSELLARSSGTEIEGEISNDTFDYGSFINSASNFEKLKEQGVAKDLTPIYFTDMEPRFIRIAARETATQRTVRYQVTTFVRDSIDDSPVPNQNFDLVKHLSGKREQIKTDDLGRLLWYDDIPHFYYHKEKYFFPKFSLRQQASGYKTQLVAAINPWDEGWTFGKDATAKERQDYYKALNRRDLRPPRLMVDAFRYQTIRFRYVIDEYMTLNVKKAVVMALDPLVQRSSIIKGRMFEPLRDGIYLAKIALVKKYIDPFVNGVRFIKDEKLNRNYVLRVQDEKLSEKAVGNKDAGKKGEFTTVIKKLLRVQAGRITTPLEFSMRDLRMMTIRSNIMVQLETIDEMKLLSDNTMDAKIKEQEADYLAYNSEGMTEEDKAKFLEEKQALFEQERTKLLEFLGHQRETLQEDKQELAGVTDIRVAQLGALIDRLGLNDSIEDSARYKQIMEMDREDYVSYLQDTRSNFDSMIKTLDKHWAESRANWVELKRAANQNGEGGTVPTLPDSQIIFEHDNYDYLYNMQMFMDEFNLGDQVGYTDLEKLKLNDYTVNPAAPFINLDLYKQDSGLATRTFIGPCTLVENDNMSEMRPTDTLDEKHSARVDSSELLYLPRIVPPDNSAFEESPYHDSLKPYTDWHVGRDVIPWHIQNEKRYEQKMMATSTLANYLSTFDLNYVSIDEPSDPRTKVKRFIQGCDFDNDESSCFKEDQSRSISFKKFESLSEDFNIQEALLRFYKFNPFHRLERINDKIVNTKSLAPLWKRPLLEVAIPVHTWQEISESNGTAEYGRSMHLKANTYLEKKDFTLNKDIVNTWVRDGVSSLKLEDALMVCHIMAKNISEKLTSLSALREEKTTFQKVLSLRNNFQNYYMDYCASRIKYIPSAQKVFFDGLSFQRQDKVFRTGQYEHKSGKNMNLNVGTDFSLSNYTDLNTSYGMGLGAGGVLGLINPVLGSTLALTASNSKSTGSNDSQSLGTSIAAFLVIQKAELEIELKEFEKCLNIQNTREFIRGLKASYFLKEGLSKSDPGIFKVLNSGFFICTGKVDTETPEKEPYKVTENYYYLTQHFTAGEILDDVNLLNHVWLLALRGDNDFNTFMDGISGTLRDSQGGLITERRSGFYNYPLDHLKRVYSTTTPSFPGIYTVPEKNPYQIINAL